MPDPIELLSYTATVVSAFVSNNTVRADELPDLIAAVHGSLAGAGAPPAKEEPAPKLSPAVPIRKSVTDDYIISLEDGRKFKSMKRYLALLGMTPDEYRAKWGLPSDYPMVAAGYSTKRSELAKAAGLGRKAADEPVPRQAPKTAEPEPKVAELAVPPKKRAGRPRKADADLLETTALTPAAPEPPTAAAEPEAPPPEKRRGRPKKAAAETHH